MIEFNEYFQDIYTVRLAVMLETYPQSNKYTQIMLTEEKFKKFSDFMFNLLEPDGGKEVKVIGADERVEMSDSLKCWYTQEEIDSNANEDYD